MPLLPLSQASKSISRWVYGHSNYERRAPTAALHADASACHEMTRTCSVVTMVRRACAEAIWRDSCLCVAPSWQRGE